MKSLNLLSFFKRPSVLAFAMLIAGVFAFSSNATADEKKFDALSGVTAQVLTPPAMDAIQGMGSIHVGFHVEDALYHFDIVPLRTNGGPWDIWIRLELSGSGKIIRTRS